MPRKRADIPWDTIRIEYTDANITQADLAKKYGIHPNSLARKATKEGWARGHALAPVRPAEIAPAPLLGVRHQDNVAFIIEKVKLGWTPVRAFGACGFTKEEMAEWLSEDPAFFALTAAARQATLGIAEEALWKSAANRGIYDAALKFLVNSPETREQYTSERASGGQRIEINVQIGNTDWDRNRPPIIDVNGDEVGRD